MDPRCQDRLNPAGYQKVEDTSPSGKLGFGRLMYNPLDPRIKLHPRHLCPLQGAPKIGLITYERLLHENVGNFKHYSN